MASNTILLKGRGIRKEGPASAAITPGELIMRNATNQVAPHGTAKAATLPAFAVENELLGKEITVDWPSGDNVVYEVMPPGAEVFALVAAGASAITIGDLLESAGDGTLQKLTAFAQSGITPFAVTTGGHAIARALETVNNSGGGTEVRIKVEIV